MCVFSEDCGTRTSVLGLHHIDAVHYFMALNANVANRPRWYNGGHGRFVVNTYSHKNKLLDTDRQGYVMYEAIRLIAKAYRHIGI